MRLFACSLILLTFAITLPETSVSAADTDVPHPTLPKGAGTIDADAPKTFMKTASGLQYRVLRKGEGVKPKASNTVKVNYHGWLDNGKMFDRGSYESGMPIEFGLTGVIPGWTEGMQLVGKGGMIELLIPSNLGYGKRGAGTAVPPDATLHFLVELQDFMIGAGVVGSMRGDVGHL